MIILPRCGIRGEDGVGQEAGPHTWLNLGTYIKLDQENSRILRSGHGVGLGNEHVDIPFKEYLQRNYHHL